MKDIYDNTGEFTKTMLDKFFETYYSEYDEYNDIIEYLNNAKNFRTFDEGLTEFIKNHGYFENENLKPEDCIKQRTNFLYNKFKSKNIPISKVTLKNYFSGKTRPDGKKTNRNNVFKLCFAMDLDVEETNIFFNKIYLDRTFNIKNVQELVYYFCIKNHKTYANACELIEEAEKILKNKSSNDYTISVHTDTLKNETDYFTTKEDLLMYVENNKNSFNRYNVTAIEQFNNLLNTVQGSKEDRDFINKLRKQKSNMTSKDIIRLKNCGLVIQDALNQNLISHTKSTSEYSANKDISSIDFMFFVIYNSNLPIGVEKTYSFANNANLLKLIKSNFPSKHIFSNIKSDPLFSFEALRKAIILLKFYTFCFYEKEQNFRLFENEQEISRNEILCMFCDEINDLMSSCGMGPLYVGNPYDCLFLFCIANENPLDVFRDIILEACIFED